MRAKMGGQEGEAAMDEKVGRASSTWPRREASQSRPARESRRRTESSEKVGAMYTEAGKRVSSNGQEWGESHGKERVRCNGHTKGDNQEDPWDVALRRMEHGSRLMLAEDGLEAMTTEEAFLFMSSYACNLTLEEQKVRAWDDQGAMRNLIVTFALTTGNGKAEDVEACGAVDAFGGPNLHAPEVLWPSAHGSATRGADMVATSSDELQLNKLVMLHKKSRTRRKSRVVACGAGLQSCGSGIRIFPPGSFACDSGKPLLPSPAQTPLVIPAPRLGTANGGLKTLDSSRGLKHSSSTAAASSEQHGYVDSSARFGLSKPPAPQGHRRAHSGGAGQGATWSGSSAVPLGSGSLVSGRPGSSVAVQGGSGSQASVSGPEVYGNGRNHSKTSHGRIHGLHKRSSSRESAKGLDH